MNLLIICGETSANAYGFKLAQAMSSRGHLVYSFGDAKLSDVSTQLLAIDSTQHQVGFGGWKAKSSTLQAIQDTVEQSRVGFDAAIIIDFSSYNFKIARILSQKKIPIFTFITPNFWLWNQKRLAKKVLDYSEKVIAIYQAEYDFYAALSADKVVYLGHPLSLETTKTPCIQGPPHTIGMFPGSRESEVTAHLPVMARIIEGLRHHHDVSVAVICESPSLRALVATILTKHGCDDIPIDTNSHRPLTYAVTAPGTNTLRLALMGTPMTIIGQLNPWIYPWVKLLLGHKIQAIGLPNIILNRHAFNEYIQVRKPDDILNDISQALASESRRATMREDCELIQKKVNAPAAYYDQLSRIICDHLSSDLPKKDSK